MLVAAASSLAPPLRAAWSWRSTFFVFVVLMGWPRLFWFYNRIMRPPISSNRSRTRPTLVCHDDQPPPQPTNHHHHRIHLHNGWMGCIIRTKVRFLPSNWRTGNGNKFMRIGTGPACYSIFMPSIMVGRPFVGRWGNPVAARRIRPPCQIKRVGKIVTVAWRMCIRLRPTIRITHSI